MAVAGWSLISNFQHLEETRLDLDKPDLDDSRRKKRQEKNLRRKQRRLAKKDSLMRPVRQGTPIPDLAPPSSGSEQFKIAATVLTDKNSSIIVDLSNYRPFTAASSGDEPFLFGSPEPETERCPPLLNSPEVQLRFLNPGDLCEVKRLCREWFPIEYPDSWYSDITSNNKFYAVACVLRGQIIGLVVAEIKDAFKLPKEDSSILAPTFRNGTKIGYILSLGKSVYFLGNGKASTKIGW